MEENRICLLDRELEYYDNCPGCKMDRLKQEQTGVPYKHLSFIWIVSLCTALPISSLFPFIYFMIRDFHIAKREEDIGYYAGFLGSSFMVGRALTSLCWGYLADRYGRKPIILIGTSSVVVFNTIFGLSTSFWMALSMRFLLGCFNSLLGTIRAYASEVCSKEYRSLALSVVSTSRGIGLIIGPAIGGFFAQPAEKYPNVFAKSSIFGRYPYFLPCLIISVSAVGVLIACKWLPETLHRHGQKGNEINGPSEPSSDESGRKDNIEQLEERQTRKANLLKNWPLMSTIIVYCVFSLQEMAYSEIFSLWAVSDKKYGGLSFSSQEVGEVLAISGVGLLLFQLLLYPPVERILGPLMVTRLSAAISIPLLACYPYIAMLSGVSVVTGLFILQNNAVRGAANGISVTAMSVFKAFGPAGGGALFSWAQKRQVASFLPGDQMVFFALNVVQFIGLLLTFKPFLAEPRRQ
ncbi:Tetracycline resistance protein, TetA/multidrug resistance protein MdtG [Corchorus olitorius]|uniref:Tetracycline resistance protein, TetA/multidrug resistance protein MdtG n=1 Tax=Corchorus olitorius TaxID=93759 RepID=A0A1R3J9H1_9ROSI|nr:Tetracycline resistance protein, TetA/multidrug resistance protein MdtG [Corchorus olitorius]